MTLHLLRHERGGATIEFAVLIPSVCLVLALCLSGVQLAAHQVRLSDAAALAARTAGRGGSAAILAGQLVPGASVYEQRQGNLVCVRLDARGSSLAQVLGFGTVSATGCALAQGR